MILYVLIFMLLNISGAQGVHTIRQVSLQEGESIIIPCWYNHIYVKHVKYLNVGQFWATSKCVVRSDGRVTHKTFSVWDNKTVNILTVEMRRVLKSQAGKYWCGIEKTGPDVRKGFKLKVTTGISRLYVANQMLTGFEGGSVNILCHHHATRIMDEEWCRLGGACMKGTSGTLDGASVRVNYSLGLMMVTMSKLKMDNTGWYWCSVKKHQMPVHITVYKRRETTIKIATTIKIETTSEQSKSSSTKLFLVTFTSSQNLHHSETRSLLWLIILGINLLIVILSCIAVYLCKKKRNLPKNTSLRKHQSNTESEETDSTMCEAQAEQATAGESEIIYTTVQFIKHQQTSH